jgi:hypothetical protein
MKRGSALQAGSLFIFRALRARTPRAPPSALAHARLDQDAPLLDLGPKGRCPLGLSRRTHVAALVLRMGCAVAALVLWMGYAVAALVLWMGCAVAALVLGSWAWLVRIVGRWARSADGARGVMALLLWAQQVVLQLNQNLINCLLLVGCQVAPAT